MLFSDRVTHNTYLYQSMTYKYGWENHQFMYLTALKQVLFIITTDLSNYFSLFKDKLLIPLNFLREKEKVNSSLR